MAAESGGGGSQNDGFNWAMLSHSYDHQPERRINRGRGRGINRRRGRGSGKAGSGPKDERRKAAHSTCDSYANSNYYDRHVAEFSTSSVSNKVSQGDDFFLHAQETFDMEHSDIGQKRRLSKQNNRRSDGASSWRGKGKNHHESSVESGRRQGGAMFQERDCRSKGIQEAKRGYNSNRDQDSNGRKGDIVDGKYVPNRNKDDRHRQERDNMLRTNTVEKKNDYFRSGNRNRGNERAQKRGTHRSKKPIDSEQARLLTELLVAEDYECMVCCEYLKSSHATWCCQNCYHIFHLRCIKQWVKSSSASEKGDVSGWRCPGCQNVTEEMPSAYICFCGKMLNPEWNPRAGVIPHSCGEVCKKQRKTPPCPHLCNELCHPGPCPTCPVMVSKECPCGKTRTKMRCGQTVVLKCKGVCGKRLNCGKHECTDLCHEGSCSKCDVIEEQYCYCGKETRRRQCGEDMTYVVVDDKGMARYPCDQLCSRALDCGNHFCLESCHPGSCHSCALLPKNYTFCPCKQTCISDLLGPEQARQSCLDPIPCCDNFCGKKLQCGSPGNEHYCKQKCHVSPCSPCDGITLVKCRCGLTDSEIPCKEFDPEQQTLCERRCNKKRRCGRHRCNQKCCMDEQHNCPLICGRKLTCGLHKCDELCHQGSCPRCWQTSFEERTCHCGHTVQYPPIPCGAPLPQCNMPCSRPHPCQHEPQHNCHNEEKCPPCVVLMEKLCLCGREIRKSVPCHLSNVSCGRPCGKELNCKMHKCLKICHKGECLLRDEFCKQPCTTCRRDCPHPCGAPCHASEDCPEVPCKSQIVVKCKCGRKSGRIRCLAGNSRAQYHRLSSEAMGDRLRNLRSGKSIDISGLILAEKRRGMDCDEECAIYERNKRLADALGIDNPEANTFTSLQYSTALKEEAKRQLPFVKTVEEAIEDLIHKIKKSSLSQISHSFPPMNSSQRKLIHELAEHYNCKTMSYDPEPKRNTAVTATKDSVLVNMRLSTVIERKMNKTISNPILLLDEKPLSHQRSERKTVEQKAKESPGIDYFDDDFE